MYTRNTYSSYKFKNTVIKYNIFVLIGLFHKAIVQSGGIYCPWGYPGHMHDLMKKIGDKSSFSSVTGEIVMKILKADGAENLGEVLLNHVSTKVLT